MLKDACVVVSSLFVFGRTYLVLHHLVCLFFVCLHLVLCCVSVRVVVVIRRGRCA